jgi:hypothetical protein
MSFPTITATRELKIITAVAAVYLITAEAPKAVITARNSPGVTTIGTPGGSPGTPTSLDFSEPANSGLKHWMGI